MEIAKPHPKAVSKRPHTKSRLGCYNCKTRKIKCPETKPECENCIAKGVRCEYPERKAPWYGDSQANGGLIPNQPNPTSFSVQDMGFFHHYLLVAHPYLPFGCDTAWVAAIPLIAHQHEFVMHAILGLGAAHLSVIRPNGDPITAASAIEHRGRALKGLHELMAKPELSATELDALLATCYALTMQTGYMFDALVDFVIFIRGCSLVTTRILQENAAKSVFPIAATEDIIKSIPKLTEDFEIDSDLVQGGIESLQSLIALLEDEVHTYFHKCLLNTLFAVQASRKDVFHVYEKNYSAWYDISEAQFAKFIAPENLTTLILFAHHIAIETVMIPVLISVLPERARVPEVTLYQVQWVDVIYRQLPSHLTKYIRWPLEAIYRSGTENKVFSLAIGEKLKKGFWKHVESLRIEDITPTIDREVLDTP